MKWLSWKLWDMWDFEHVFFVADLIHLGSHPQEKTKIYTREDFHEVLTKVADFHDCERSVRMEHLKIQDDPNEFLVVRGSSHWGVLMLLGLLCHLKKKIHIEWYRINEQNFIEFFACQFCVETHIRLGIGSSLSWFLWAKWMDQYLIELVQGTAPLCRVSLLVSLPGLEKRRDQVGGLLRWPVSLTVVSLLDCGHVSFTRPRSVLPVFLGTAQHFILNAYGLTLTTP